MKKKKKKIYLPNESHKLNQTNAKGGYQKSKRSSTLAAHIT